MKTIGLSMIVKDEAHVILKCLESVRPLVDYVLVVDTGSTDGTQQIVWDYLLGEKLPGSVVEEPWQNFAYNRTFALHELRKAPHVDYTLIIDADDGLELDDGFDPDTFKAGMDQDLYDVEVSHGNIIHIRPQLFRNDLPFSFKGVVHEYLEAPPGELSRGRATGFRVKISGGGARSRNTRKFEDDAVLLEHTLATETDPFLVSRYTFYLAQSYRDCDEKEKALENYLKRAELGYWDQEIYISLFEAGNLLASLGRPFDEVIATYMRASDLVPSRAEALHAASRHCRNHGRNAEGYEIARRGIDLTQPAGALFAQPWTYDYGLLDEYAVNAYWAGAYRECLDASLRLLASDKLPQSTHARVLANARFAADKLPKPANLGSLGADDFIEQHTLPPARPLRARITGAPRVLLAILAKQKEPALPLYLDCIEALDYPKSSILLYIRTNNNTDRTEQILRDWVSRVGHLYAAVEFDASDVADRVEEFSEHEWNPTRFRVLGHIRNRSLQRARELDCEFYFVADVDNFIRRSTLRELIAVNLPIVGPLLRPIIPQKLYSNYHADVDADGYYKHCDQYYWILNRQVRGVVEVPVIHCTYLIRADVIPELTYQDGTDRHEYAVFSDSARKAGIPQYLDNRQVYGYITFGEGEQYVEGGVDLARGLLAAGNESSGTLAGEREMAGRTLPQRAIRLKEFLRSTQGFNTPPDWYIASADSSLKAEPFAVRTDPNGFILPEPQPRPGAPKVIFLGDSFLEGMFARPEDRVCSLLQEILNKEASIDVAILNAGYSGATALHSFNALINKILPLHPAAVVLMTGMVDFDVARLKASFWSHDPFIRPIIELNGIDPPRDQDSHSEPHYGDQTRLMLMFAQASRVFDIPLWLATIPHRQLFTGEYFEKVCTTRVDFENGMQRRCAINDVTRRVAEQTSTPLFDVERDLRDRTDIFYDMFHLNAAGGEAVARSLLKCGFAERLKEMLHGVGSRSCRARRIEQFGDPLLPDRLPRREPVPDINGRLPLYVINLDRSTDRLDQFKQRNLHLSSFTRFRAIDGANLDRRRSIEEKVIASDLDYSAGALGCAMSHIALWRIAATENRAITVAEDDAIFSRQFEGRSRILLEEARQDWDFVLWSIIPHLFTWLDALPGSAGAKVQFFEGELLRNLDKFQAAEGTPALIRLLHAFGTGCYSVSARGAQALLDRCLPIGKTLIEFPGFGVRNENEGIDSVMAGIYPLLNAFVCIPPLVVVDDSPGKSIRRKMSYS
jgi:GR25 family glycosyltransferase involved in LPS biosynthesis/glycosyltransferase involved in cell wall biosynthesis